MQTNEELLTVPETARLLRLKPSTIRSWILQRKLPFVKLGRLVRIRKSDCVALVEANLVPATGAREAALSAYSIPKAAAK